MGSIFHYCQLNQECSFKFQWNKHIKTLPQGQDSIDLTWIGLKEHLLGSSEHLMMNTTKYILTDLEQETHFLSLSPEKVLV